jgi:hypothetical protein
MSKFLPNLLVQIFKVLVYSKIKFYSEKNFPVTFGPTGHLLLPPAPEPSAHDVADRPRAAPTVNPDASTGRKKQPHQSPFIPPLIGTISPSSITSNRHLQLGPLKLLQRRPLKVLGLPRLASAL